MGHSISEFGKVYEIDSGKTLFQYPNTQSLGTQTIAKNMASSLKPGSLYLEAPVTHIEQSSTNGLCSIRTSNNKTFQARKTILSIATPLYNSIQFMPSLPADKQRLAQENKLGYYSKLIFVFESPWWRTAGFSGEIKSQDEGPILFSVDTSIPDDNQWSISCFIVGGRGQKWSELSKEKRYSTAWAQFCSAFEEAQRGTRKFHISEPINVLEFEWSKEPFFLGGPCAASPPGLLSSIDGAAIRKPFGDIHFIGTETALAWKGYMEGAVRSGDRGAEEVIAALCQ